MLGLKLIFMLVFRVIVINSQLCSNHTENSETVQAYMQESFETTTSEVKVLFKVLLEIDGRQISVGGKIWTFGESCWQPKC